MKPDLSAGGLGGPPVPAFSGKPLIELAQVTKSYRYGELEVEVLHGISLKIYSGEFIAITGASGSGKTTLMNILGCLDRPTRGVYRFMGRAMCAVGQDELACLRGEAFGFIFQNCSLIGTATVLENIEVPALCSGEQPAQRKLRAMQLLASLGLAGRFMYRPDQLSGGQRQRVAIARALMNGGRIILADEPTGALDGNSAAEIMALLQDLPCRGYTVIFITQVAEIAAQAQRKIELSDGRIVHDSGPRFSSVIASELVMTDVARERNRNGATASFRGALEAAKTAMRALLRANLFRIAFALPGIVVGVAAMIAMLAIGDGAGQTGVLDNNLLVRPGLPDRRGAVAALMPEDAEAIAVLPNVLAALPELEGSVAVHSGNSDHQIQITGTAAVFPQARAWPVARGIFFSDEDIKSYAAVAVLGRTVAERLFAPGIDPVGQYVVLNNVLFQVIGLMAARGPSPKSQDLDNVVLVPFTSGGLRLFGRNFLHNIRVVVKDTALLGETQDAVTALLKARHRTGDLQISARASIPGAVTDMRNTPLLACVAMVSLLMGGMGVMHIMLVNVAERTREIGIRMATGARMRTVMQQFLTEALLVALLGGLAGIVIGLGVTALIEVSGTPVKYSVGPVLFAFGCAFAVGLLFGYMPARKAACVDPVMALAT